jgi:predicted Co/Zn/Cd cation transporter (cation efflux family)
LRSGWFAAEACLRSRRAGADQAQWCQEAPVSDRLQQIANAEVRSLRASIAVTIGLTAVTLVVGLVTASQLLILEAAFGVIGLLSTWMALAASRAADRGPTRRFPYGLDSLTPLVVAVQGVALGATLVYAAITAVLDILAGGHPVNTGVVAVIAALAGVASIGFAAWLRRLDPGSDLIAAEAHQWQAGGIRALVAAVGAGAGAVAIAAGAGFTDYIDSALVLVACALVVPVPVKLVRHGLNELLEGVPDDATCIALDEAVTTVTESFPLPTPHVRATKLGLKVYLDVRYEMQSPDVTIGFEDEVRRAMADAVSHLPLDVWSTVQLTFASAE